MVQPYLLRVPTGTGVQMAMAPSPAARAEALAGNFNWTSDVQIEGLRTPITRIVLRGDDDGSNQQIYTCASTTNADECLVDLHTNAFEDLLSAAPVPVRPGTYNRIEIHTCLDGQQGYTNYLKASVSLGGTEYFTKAAGGISPEGEAEYAPLEHSGCASDYPLPQPVVVSDTLGEIIPVRLYFDMTDIAMAADGDYDTRDSWRGGCSGDRPEGPGPQPFVCITYPDVAGTTGAAAPVFERYRINGSATFGFFFDAATDQPLGGFTRPFFTEGDGTQPGFNPLTAFRFVVGNGDGTYTVQSYGEAGSADYWAFKTDEFRREDHTGTFTADNGTVTATYTAVRIN
ncbi:MAG TPA: hypothetical protein VFI91_13610 [Longimicrobiaceae bacterium]|nr:hypothetical protein [Longimicrobiaceae bacterium]